MVLNRTGSRMAHTWNVTSTETMRLGPIIPLLGTDNRDSYDLYNTVGPVINCLWSLSGSLSNFKFYTSVSSRSSLATHIWNILGCLCCRSRLTKTHIIQSGSFRSRKEKKFCFRCCPLFNSLTPQGGNCAWCSYVHSIWVCFQVTADPLDLCLALSPFNKSIVRNTTLVLSYFPSADLQQDKITSGRCDETSIQHLVTSGRMLDMGY